MTAPRSALRDRLRAVDDRIAAACQRAGRRREEVTLVAVTKTVTTEVAALLPELGTLDLGESRPQELWVKAVAIPVARWHLIGHLQRNKIERTLPLVELIHSVDSLRLLQALDEHANKQNRTVNVLLEVNTARDPNKGGLAPEELPVMIESVAQLRRVNVLGLMAMAALDDHPEKARPTFADLRALRDRWLPRAPHLSMGMSNDFEVGIEEGATMVRLGSVLFADLPEDAS
jgi:pyridoxal phosphate enzyme (YggS family)